MPKKYPSMLREVGVKMLRKAEVPPINLGRPRDVATAWRAIVETAPWYDPFKEHLVVFYLDVRNSIIAMNVVSVGALTSCPVSPAGVFRAAVVNGANALVMTHNHPSGSANPSEADLQATREMIDAGKLLEIEVLDHVIISNDPDGGYYSVRENAVSVQF